MAHPNSETEIRFAAIVEALVEPTGVTHVKNGVACSESPR